MARKALNNWTILFTLFGLLIAQPAAARFSLGLGGYTEMMTHLQDSAASKNGLFSPNLSLYFSKSFRDSGDFGFAPDMTITFISSDESHGVQLISLNPNFIYKVYDNIDLRFGLGLMFRKVSGDGGAVTVRNGSTGTLTAFRPGASSLALNFTVNVGADFTVYENIQTHLQFYFQGVLGGAAFQANNFVGISYVF